MAECYDRFGRVGGKARGTRSQFRLNTEGLLPFKCTYPAHLTDVMDAVPSTQSDLRRADLVSPVRGTRTRAVREYEQTIEELKKENFDLKLRLFLLEDTKNKNYLRNKGSNNEDQDNTVQVIVELKLETEALRTELTTNKQLLQEANEQKEKYVSDLKELQDKFDQLQEELSTVTYHPSEQEIRLLKDENESLQKSNEFSNKIITEKDQEIENVNDQLEDLSNKNKALEAKVKKSSLAIQGIVSKYYKDIEMIPKEIRPIVQTAVQAAKENRKMDLVNAIESFKASLSELISTDGNESKATTSKDSMEELQKLAGVSKSLEELTQNKGQSHQRSKLTCEENKSSDSIHESEKSGKSESREDLDQMFDVVKENENLKVDIAEKSKIIDNMNAACNEFEQKIALLQNELSDALSKVKDLEIRINEEKGKQISSLPTKDSAIQTAVQWHSMQSKVSDKFLQNAGHSNNLDDLKEEVLTLLLVIEQKDKEISDFEQQIKSLQTQLDQENKKDVSFANLDKDDVRERSELRQRLAHSCAINNELMVHLRNLEVFMEDLLQHKNLDGSSLENISATSGFLSHLKIQREIEQSLELTSVLNDELSICEGSKIFDPNDASVSKDFNQSHQPVNTSRLSLNNSNIPSVIQGRNNPSQLSLKESPTNAAGTGTSNNEDLILLLNEKGDPEDVLIRNNHSYMDKNSPAIDNGEQLRRRCWESSTMNYLNIERAVMEHRTEQWCDSKLENPNAVHLYPSSDSDIWSEPDRDVSLQRIGIDLQKSPVSQRSPRRSRFRDKSTDGVSSQKNESSSSFNKLHTWSKRRRNSDTLKSSSICKKCMSHFQPSDTPSKEGKIDSFQKAIDQLSNTCNYQENQLEKAVFELRSKKDIIDSLIKEKQEMLNYIDHLKETNQTVAEQDSESAEKMSKLSMENMKLQNLIRELESRMSHSEGVYNQMKAELEKTKTQLKLLEAKCMEYEEELVIHSNFKNDYTQRLKEVEKEKTKLLDEIETLLVEKNELLSIIEAEKSEKQHFEMENQVLKNKLEENSKEMSLLKESSKNLELVKNELYKERQTIKELLCKIEDEKENRQHFMQENHALKKRLEENSKEVSLLKASSKDLEHVENELLREREMVKELLHKIEAEHENMQHFEKENHAMKRRLEENSKELSLLKASSKNLEHVKNELLKERQMVKELLSKIEAENENKQYFEEENHALKRRLEEKSKEVSLLKASSKDLEHVKNELLSERQMVKELLSKIEAENENKQYFEKEIHVLKSKLEENSKEVSLLRASSKDLEHVKNELLKERQMVKELLSKIEAENENKQYFEKEIHALKSKLEENSKEVSLLKASNEDLENIKNELLKEKEKSETDLLSSHSMCNELQNDLKKIKDRLKDAESKCIRYETELNESLKYQHFIFKSLSSVKDEVFTNLDSLAYVCKEYLNADFGNIVDKKSPLSIKDKPDQIGKLFEDIFGTCTNFDQMLQFLSEQLSSIQSLKEKSKTVDVENKYEIVKLQKLLDKKEKEIQSIEIQNVNLQQKIQENKEKECKLESMQQKLEMAENELNVLNERKTKMEVMVKEFQETLRNKEKSLEDLSLRNSASERQLDGFKSEIQKYQNLLNMKDDEITKLQERIFNMQTHINNLLTNKTSLSVGQMSTSSKDDIKGNISNTSDAPSISRDSSFSSIASEKDDDVYKKFEKYSKKIKALQTKLSITEKRIEILEKEKADLREEFFAQIQKDKTKTKSSEELEALSKELIELKTTLKTKTSFIKDLKNELFKTCNSLVDKQKEVDELQHKLSAARKNAVAKSPSSPLEFNSQYSDPIHKSVEANIKELKNHKWELIQGILKQQKVFYEKKNIHLGHFEKFKNHIEKLRSLQISQSLFKSGSEPLLNTPMVANSFYAEKCDKTLKNLQIELQLDVECLQNLKIFLKRFFIPLVLQNCSCAATSPKPDDDSHDGKQSNQASSEMKDMKKELKLDLWNSSSVEVMRSGSASSSSDRLISTASVVAHNLESVENALKKVKHILHQFEENNSLVGETPKKTAAKSLLLKMMEEITSLQENSEIFHLNSVLKSLGLFDIHIPQSPSKQDMSDRESLLSEETIALSRSGSLSPMSFEENFPSKLYTSGVRQKQESESFGKNESGNKQSLGISQKLALGGSQDSLFLRSHFSSPDLGIESDPNHESSAPEQQEKDFRDGSIRMSKRHLPESSYSFTDTSVNIKEVSSAIGNALHAIGYLQEYELLKKEVQESLVGIKTVLTRTGDGLQHVAKFTSPQKNLEYSTFKAIKDACGNIEVCLQKAIKLVDNFWVAPCPSVKELNMLIQQNQDQQQKLKILHESKQRQERYLEEITEKYKQAERYRENVEKKISKKLVKTKKVIRRAEFKILEKENQDLPSIPKYPFDESACQSRS
ncbi:cnn_1N domain-containing protein [Trichonephila clavata]|uniref:Cnn_1N domain-containing protein n=1 Tax=Trichonephila clavata TaxID=2740835 RepID=A0A8X6LH84_TRICU|nr:cnn_1N domain-containing protein [Trichonephila clavata]